MRSIIGIIEMIVLSGMVISLGFAGMLVWRILKRSYRSGFKMLVTPWPMLPGEIRKNLKTLWLCLSIIMAGAILLFLSELVLRYAG
jgi:hypothetical protein